MATTMDIRGTLSPVQSLAPALVAASADGATADLAGYSGAYVLVSAGVVTDGTHTLKLQESDNDSDWDDVAADDMLGSFTALTTSTDAQAYEVEYIGTARYLRAVTTVTGSPSTGGLYGVTILRANPRVRPAS